MKAGFDKLKPGEFLISVDDFKDSFKHYTVTYLHDDWNNSFIEKRQALNRKNYRFNFTISDEDVGIYRPVAEPKKPVAAPAAEPKKSLPARAEASTTQEEADDE